MGNRTVGMNRAHKLKSKRSARIGVLILMGGMLALITEAQFEPRMVKVARVIDGDTIQVLSDGRQYTVRLIGADTPETKHPTKAVQRFGQEASAFTTAALEGRTVQLETDRTGDTVGPLWALGFATFTWTARTSTPGSSVRDTLTPSGAFDTRSGPCSYGSKKQRSGWERAYGPRLESNRPGLAPDRCPGVPSRGDPNATSG